VVVLLLCGLGVVGEKRDREVDAAHARLVQQLLPRTREIARCDAGRPRTTTSATATTTERATIKEGASRRTTRLQRVRLGVAVRLAARAHDLERQLAHRVARREARAVLEQRAHRVLRKRSSVVAIGDDDERVAWRR